MIKKLILTILLIFSLLGNCFAATFQYIISGTSDDPVTTGAADYSNLMGNGNAIWASGEINRESVIPTAGTLSDFKVQVKTAPGADNSWTFVVRKNNADTALSVSIADTNTISALDTDSVSVVAGDKVCISAVGTGTPTAAAAVYWYCKFTPTTAGETILLSGGAGWTTSLLFGTVIGSKIADATVFDAQTLFPTAGTLKNFYIELTVAPGAGTSRTFTIEKNGVDSGITITISETATTGNDTVNTLAVVAGDQVTIQQTAVTGSPATTVLKSGIVFLPTTEGEWFTAATTDDPMLVSATEYQHLTCGDSTLTATKNEQYNLCPATTAKNIYVALSVDPGTSPDAYSFTLRDDVADTALTVTITADATTGNFATDVTIAADSVLDTAIAPLNVPTGTPASQIAYLFYDAPTGATRQRIMVFE